MSDRFAEEARRWSEILGSCAVSDAAESAEMFQPYLEDMLRRARIEVLEEAAAAISALREKPYTTQEVPS
jgi:hypothetical protein